MSRLDAALVGRRNRLRVRHDGHPAACTRRSPSRPAHRTALHRVRARVAGPCCVGLRGAHAVAHDVSKLLKHEEKHYRSKRHRRWLQKWWTLQRFLDRALHHDLRARAAVFVPG